MRVEVQGRRAALAVRDDRVGVPRQAEVQHELGERVVRAVLPQVQEHAVGAGVGELADVGAPDVARAIAVNQQQLVARAARVPRARDCRGARRGQAVRTRTHQHLLVHRDRPGAHARSRQFGRRQRHALRGGQGDEVIGVLDPDVAQLERRAGAGYRDPARVEPENQRAVTNRGHAADPGDGDRAGARFRASPDLGEGAIVARRLGGGHVEPDGQAPRVDRLAGRRRAAQVQALLEDRDQVLRGPDEAAAGEVLAGDDDLRGERARTIGQEFAAVGTVPRLAVLVQAVVEHAAGHDLSVRRGHAQQRRADAAPPGMQARVAIVKPGDQADALSHALIERRLARQQSCRPGALDQDVSPARRVRFDRERPVAGRQSAEFEVVGRQVVAGRPEGDGAPLDRDPVDGGAGVGGIAQRHAPRVGVGGGHAGKHQKAQPVAFDRNLGTPGPLSGARLLELDRQQRAPGVRCARRRVGRRHGRELRRRTRQLLELRLGVGDSREQQAQQQCAQRRA